MTMVRMQWSEYSQAVVERGLSIQVVSDNDVFYKLLSYDGPLAIECSILKSETADVEDFENNYSSVTGKQVKANVRTQFEDEEIVLKLMRAKGQADANGDLVLTIPIPGSFPSVGRYAAGFWCFTDNYGWDDHIEMIEVVDVDGLTGMPAGTVLKVYHEDELDPENKGWFFWLNYATEGEVEVEPLGYYGQIVAGLSVRITFKVAANAKVKINGYWGKRE